MDSLLMLFSATLILGGYGVRDEGLDGVVAQLLEHVVDLMILGANMTVREGVEGGEQRGGGLCGREAPGGCPGREGRQRADIFRDGAPGDEDRDTTDGHGRGSSCLTVLDRRGVVEEAMARAGWRNIENCVHRAIHRVQKILIAVDAPQTILARPAIRLLLWALRPFPALPPAQLPQAFCASRDVQKFVS